MADVSLDDLIALMPHQTAYEIVSGNTITPSFTSLTIVGSVTTSCTWYDIGGLIFITVRIVSGGGTSASVAGTTYMTLPINNAVSVPAHAANVTTLAGITGGLVTNGRLYLPDWAATTNEFVLSAVYPRA